MATVEGQLFACDETTPGTKETPEATEVIDYLSCDFTATGGPLQRDVKRAYHDRQAPTATNGIHWSGTLETEMKASTAAGTAPEQDALFKSAGFDAAISAGVSVTYEQFDDPNAAANQASMTLQKEELLDGDKYVAHGCRSGMSLAFGTDVTMRATWPWVGGYTAPAAVASNTAATYNAGVPLSTMADTSPCTIHGYAAIVRSGTIDLGQSAIARPHAGGTADNGYHYWPAFLSRDGNVTWSFEVEQVDETAFAKWTAMRAATASTITLNFAAGSRTLQILLRATVITGISIAEGTPLIASISGVASRSGTDGAIALVYE